MMTFVEFETKCNPLKTPLDSRDITFWGCGLGGECGEVQNLCKKVDRDQPFGIEGVVIDQKILDEAGDTLFYLTQVLHKRGMTLNDAARGCLIKLEQMSVK